MKKIILIIITIFLFSSFTKFSVADDLDKFLTKLLYAKKYNKNLYLEEYMAIKYKVVGKNV